jgi:hypothetical protein
MVADCRRISAAILSQVDNDRIARTEEADRPVERIGTGVTDPIERVVFEITDVAGQYLQPVNSEIVANRIVNLSWAGAFLRRVILLGPVGDQPTLPRRIEPHRQMLVASDRLEVFVEAPGEYLRGGHRVATGP